MEVKGLTPGQLTILVRNVSLDRYKGNVIVDRDPTLLNRAGTRFRVRIRVKDSRGPGARRSWAGRRMPAACWHVFRDVIALVLEAFPAATVSTSMARYDAATFDRVYPTTASINVGSVMSPAYMPDLCDCD